MSRNKPRLLKALLLVTSALVTAGAIGTTAARAGGLSGGVVAVGSATISTPASNKTVIDQTSAKALINWDAFSIPGGYSVEFHQPTASAIAVNRVVGPNASAIDGQLLANGNVWLINSNGIVFGQGAQVNVGGLIATTSDISDDDFRNGRFRFAKPSSDAAVENKGTLIAGEGGSIVLSAAHVENEGLIKADLGSVVLGGARTFSVDFDGDNLIRYQIGEPIAETPKGNDGTPQAAIVANSGTVTAAGGTVLMTARAARNVENNVINNSGIVEASSVSMRNGEIVFDAGPDGTVNAGGAISASGERAQEAGGSISITGGTVNVEDGAKLDVSGDKGGGKIEIGGGGAIANAKATNVGKASIKADAISSGNGGTVTVWSDGNTAFNAKVSAKGGAQGGNGGFVETSGKVLQLGDAISVNTSAPNGRSGTWLLDPVNIVVTTVSFNEPETTGVDPATIINSLSLTDVVLEASNNIVVDESIIYSSNHSFSLFAGNDLTFRTSVINSGTGAIIGKAGWVQKNPGPDLFGENGGSITLGGTTAHGDVIVGSRGLTEMDGYNVSLDATKGNVQLGFTAADGGDISITALGTLSLSAASSYAAQIGNGATFGMVSDGTVNITAPLFTASGDVYVAGAAAHITLGSDGSDGGSVGTEEDPLKVAVSSLAVQTQGANAYINSLGNSLSIGAGTDGIDLGAGVLKLSSAGAVTQTRPVRASEIFLSASGGGINLTNMGNAFGDVTVSTADGDVSLYDSLALNIVSAAIEGNLSLESANVITQEGAITADGLNASAGGSINLSSAGNAFATAQVKTGGAADAWLYDSVDLTIAGADVGGTFSLSGAGAIGQSGAIHAAALNVTAANGAINLSHNGNSFATATIAVAGDVSLYDSAALMLGNVNAGGDLTVLGASSIGQSGTIVASSLTVSSTGGDIALNDASNAFGPLSVTASGNASLHNSDDLIVANASVAGTLALSSAGAISQTGAIHAAKLDVTADAITLTNAGNDFAQAGISTAGNAALYDSANLTITGATVGGTLTLSGAGSIGQTDAITAQALNVSASDGSIVLDSAANEFGPAAITANAGDATLFDAVPLVITSAEVDGTLKLWSGGAITQTGAIHAAALDASANGNISLTDAGNAFASAMLSTAETAILYDAADLSIAGASIGGALTVAGGGAIMQTGAIEAATLNLQANSDITLTNAGNAFGALTVATAGDAAIFDSLDLMVASADAGGTLTLSSGGAVAQIGAIHAVALDVSSAHGGIVLTHAGNSFSIASLSTSGEDGATLYDSIALTIANADVSGTLTLTAKDSIDQTGAIHSGSLTVTSENGAIALTHSGNSFETAALAAGQNASLYDSTDLTISSADIGAALSLSGGGNIGQTGAIHVESLSVSAASGDITLDHSGNAFASLSVSGSGNAAVHDAQAVTVTSASLGGTFDLSSDGSIGQTGAIVAGTLKVSAAGGIVLTNAGNQFATAEISTPGNANVRDASSLTLSGADVSGTLTLSTGGTLGQSGAIHAAALVLNASGAVDLQNTGNAFDTLSLTASGDAALYDAAALTVSGADAGGALTLKSAGALSQTGAIHAASLNVTTTGGGITLTHSGNSFANLSIATSAANDTSIYDGAAMTITGATVGGALHLSGGSSISQSGVIQAGSLAIAAGGDVTLNVAGNTFGRASISTPGSAWIYDTSSLRIDGADVGGGLTILSQQDLIFASGVEAGTGLIAVAGWDGSTTDPAALVTGNAYGNGGASITIGGDKAAGNVAVGSAGGAVTIAGGDVNLSAVNGYAQLGTHGAGTGAISIYAKGDVILSGGAGTTQFAQIGHGGYQVSGNQSGDIFIKAAGDLALHGGSGDAAYAQIGHGGAKSNSNSNGYSDTGIINISAASVALAAGSGTGSYAQIGHGGYLSGQSLAAGTATLGGDIFITAASAISLAGEGDAAYAQIGHGGDLVNSGAANGTGGTISGDITARVTAKPADPSIDPVTITAGSGVESYAQIGNGGNGENTPAPGATVSFSIGGDIFVADLRLRGSNSGARGYAQLGNGDASKKGTGNVSGDITVGPGFSIDVLDGTAPDTKSLIGNETGFGTVSGTVTLLSVTPPPPPPPPPPPTVGHSSGAIAVVIQRPTRDTGSGVVVIDTVPVTGGGSGSSGGAGPQQGSGGGQSSDGEQATDNLADSLAKSLEAGGRKVATTETLLPGLMRQLGPKPQAVPPADADYSSWGNEALWL